MRAFIVAASMVVLALGSVGTSKAAIYDTINGPPGPGPFFWVPDTIGWYWTPSSDVMLEGIQTQLASGFTNINNNFTFTTTLYTDRPSEGGTVIDSFSWNGVTFVDGPWLGGSFSSALALTGGTTYFIGMAGWDQAVGWNGANSGAGVNWVGPDLGPPVENLGAGSSYTGDMFQTQLSPSGLGTTDQPVLRFIEEDTPPPPGVPEPATVVVWSVLAVIGMTVGMRQKLFAR